MMLGSEFLKQLIWHTREYNRLMTEGNDRDAERHYLRMIRLQRVIDTRYN